MVACCFPSTHAGDFAQWEKSPSVWRGSCSFKLFSFVKSLCGMCSDLDFPPFFSMTSAVINALSQRYFLQANDQNDLKDWVEALNQASKITVRMISSPLWRGPRLFPPCGLLGWGRIPMAAGAFPEACSRPSSPTSSYTLADYKLNREFESSSMGSLRSACFVLPGRAPGQLCFG